MSAKKKAVFNWSGGKDSALALQMILQDPSFEVISLLTTLQEETEKSSIHGIPLSILQQQARQIGIPLCTVSMDKSLKNYEVKMRETVTAFQERGVRHFIFGDIFLHDIKAYREHHLNPLGIEVVEPLWHLSSEDVMKAYLNSGLEAVIIVTRADLLDPSFIGKKLDPQTIQAFPADVDICGENGEYHTMVYGGSIFQQPIPFSISEVHQASYDIPLDDGMIETYRYWQAVLDV